MLRRQFLKISTLTIASTMTGIKVASREKKPLWPYQLEYKHPEYATDCRVMCETVKEAIDEVKWLSGRHKRSTEYRIICHQDIDGEDVDLRDVPDSLIFDFNGHALKQGTLHIRQTGTISNGHFNTDICKIHCHV